MESLRVLACTSRNSLSEDVREFVSEVSGLLEAYRGEEREFQELLEELRDGEASGCEVADYVDIVGATPKYHVPKASLQACGGELVDRVVEFLADCAALELEFAQARAARSFRTLMCEARVARLGEEALALAQEYAVEEW